MKKFLLLLVLVTAFVAAAQGKPEAYYLVGSMNDWASPASGGTQYPLLDENGDGIYTGTFDISGNSNQEMSFKVFNKIAGWDNPQDYYGCNLISSSLFSDRNVSIYLSSETGTSNIYIDNWVGGMITFALNSETLVLEISSSTQPVLPPAPEVYVIGKFNDWKLPRGDSDNGALRLSLSGDAEAYAYTGFVNIPAGEGDIQFYSIRRENVHAGVWGCDLPAFTVYNFNGEQRDNHLWLQLTRPGVKPYSIVNWAGGDMEIHFELNFNLEEAWCSVAGKNQPEFPFGDTIYALCDTGEGQRELQEVNSLYNYVWCSGPAPSIIYTTENSLTPSPESCWGLPEGAVLTEGYNQLVKGGQPLTMSFKELGIIRASFYGDRSLAYVSIENLGKPALPEELYLIGTPQGWDINDGSLVVPLVEETNYLRKYSATFDLQETNPRFRFYTQLGDWDNDTSIGSQYDDEPICIEVGDKPYFYIATYPGKGNWELINWEPGYLKVEISMTIYKEVSVWFQRTDDSGVKDVETCNGDAVYYNLQGVKLDAPVPGLLIKVQNGKSTKVLIN